MTAHRSRLLHVDALKALAAQAIVLHHLASYGPMAEALRGLMPALAELLFQYGRMAVQVFLVLGGFLSARGLSPQGRAFEGEPAALLWRRYLRLALPFMAAVLLTLTSSALVADALPELVPQELSAGQLLSHALLLHGVLGHEALTVGAWYVAIDMQLFALLLGLLWLAGGLPRSRALGPLLVLLLASAALWVFNLNPELDRWGIYFFGSYGLGALVHWLGRSQHRVPGLLLLSALVLGALAYDFRGRILLALLTALALALLQQRHAAGHRLLSGAHSPRWAAPLLAQAGTHSYALFLVHFPICLLVNALVARGELGVPMALLALASAWLLSNAASLPFYRWVEAPAGRIRIALPRLLRA